MVVSTEPRLVARRMICRDSQMASAVAVLIALQRADQFSAAVSQAGNDGVDVLDGECDVAEIRHVRRRVPVVALV
jgi:hypothetical protein